MCTLGKEHFDELRRANHGFLLRTIRVQRREHKEQVMSQAMALKKAQCKSIETIVRKRRLFFAGCLQRWNNE